MENNWNLVLNKIEKFFYVVTGIETLAFSDPNFDKSLIDIDEAIEIIKILKQVEMVQNRFYEKSNGKIRIIKK